jgi:hypothetical protein
VENVYMENREVDGKEEADSNMWHCPVAFHCFSLTTADGQFNELLNLLVF